MGQIFRAVAYDIDAKICCVMDADKFHANCYSHSGTVFSIHYLLRQKPYRVMWLGGYIVLWDNITKFTRKEDLIGFSTGHIALMTQLTNEDIDKLRLE